MCDKGFIWSPTNCECKCDKACNVSEYLDYQNYKYRKKLVAPLIEECTETVEEVKLAKITLAEYKIVIKAVLAHCILCYFGYFLE